MILAAPLVIPFAKAVGLSVGTLGMAALADKVNDYIQDNPEESAMILSTLIPNHWYWSNLYEQRKNIFRRFR